MSDFTGVQGQPISQLQVFEPLVGTGAGRDARLPGHPGRRGKSPAGPGRCHPGSLQFQWQYREQSADPYEEQLRRWRAAGLTVEQGRMVDGFSEEGHQTRPVVGQVLALVDRLREDTIDRVTEPSDQGSGLMTVKGLTQQNSTRQNG